jgi:hypothetical protein
MHRRVKVLLQPPENLIGSQTSTLLDFDSSQFKELGPLIRMTSLLKARGCRHWNFFFHKNQNTLLDN